MGRRGIVIAFLIVVFVTTGGVLALADSVAGDIERNATATDPPQLGIETCAAEPPPDFSDPEEDVLGWYDGYWYNEPLGFDQSDGLTDDELDAIVARTKARVEALRCLPFTEPVDVSVIDRETFLDQRGTPDPSRDTRLFENARAQALFLVNDSTDAVQVEADNRGMAVLGYYSLASSEVVLISEADGTLFVNEATLAHELGHALQDQHFGFEVWNRNTTDLRLAELGLIEGDVMFFQRAFEGHCEAGAWEGMCLEPPEREPVELANVGLYLLSFQPYSDGPSFIEHHYERGGWDAIDAMYQRFPDSAKEIIYPERYGTFETQPPSLTDRSDTDWRRISPTRHPPYDQLGEPSLFVSLVYPGLESNDERYVIESDHVFNRGPDGELDPMNPYNYSHPATDGWVGDRFMAYTEPDDPGDSLAFTQQIAFADADHASQYLHAYQRLLEVHNAEHLQGYTVPEQGAIYRIEDGDDFSGVYWVQQAGDTVTVVHAPTVGELTSVHADVEYTDVPDTTLTPTPKEAMPTQSPTPADAQPGFAVLTTVLVILSSLLLLRWYLFRRD